MKFVLKKCLNTSRDIGLRAIGALKLTLRSQTSGRVDGVIDGCIYGWATSINPSKPAALEITIDGRHKYYAECGLSRIDLVDKGVGAGFEGFSWPIPNRYLDAKPHQASFRNLSSDAPLNGALIDFRVKSDHLRGPALVRNTWTGRSSWREFLDQVTATRKVAIIASHSKSPGFLKFQLALFRQFRHAGYIVIVSHADSSEKLLDAKGMTEDIDCILRRTNLGYDFGSWAVGLELLESRLRDIDDLILVNDSMFGDYGPVLSQARKFDAPFQCLTDSYDHEHHAQSYFMRFGKEAIEEGSLLDFFLNYELLNEKTEVILKGEFGISRMMQRAGFTVVPIFPYEEVAARYLANIPETLSDMRSAYERIGLGDSPYLRGRLERVDEICDALLSGIPLNPSHFYWRTLLRDFGFNLVKRELLMRNPGQVPDIVLAQLTTILDRVTDREHIQEFVRRERSSPRIWMNSTGDLTRAAPQVVSVA